MVALYPRSSIICLCQSLHCLHCVIGGLWTAFLETQSPYATGGRKTAAKPAEFRTIANGIPDVSVPVLAGLLLPLDEQTGSVYRITYLHEVIVLLWR